MRGTGSQHEFQDMQDIIISLYSDPNFLALNILENLLSKNCFINVVTNNVEGWEKQTSHLNKERFSILQTGKHTTNEGFKYAIFLIGFVEKNKKFENPIKVLATQNSPNLKILIILPFEWFPFKESFRFSVKNNVAVVYVGDLLGPRLDLDSNLLIARSIKRILTERELVLPVGEVFYPLFVSDVARMIGKWIFSFGPYGKESFLLGSQVSGTSFWKENEKLIKNVRIIYDKKNVERYIPRGYEIKTIPSDINFYLVETYKWFAKNRDEQKKENDGTGSKQGGSKFLQVVIGGLISVFLLPFLTMAVSLGFLLFSYKGITSSGNINLQNPILVAKTFFAFTKNGSRIFSPLPILGSVYKELGFSAQVGERTTDVAIIGLSLLKNLDNLFNKTLGSTPYDSNVEGGKIEKDLDLFYKNISMIETETEVARSEGLVSARILSDKFDFTRYKNIFGQGETIAKNISTILGKEERKSYLILFQNNMELRPTGGFIGSYGVINFDGGRMNELNINDIYSADGQLRGHVEPPLPIKKYLGEANWWFRDSNWDPDFPTSAQRAEWFLDKEVDQKVDGVIAIDLQPIRDILQETGPIFLSDYNMAITADNLYEKTQEEVQKDFFPGTRKKASFLTALSRSLILEVVRMDNAKRLLVFKSLLSDFNKRHIQVYLHNNQTQDAITKIGWSGSVINPECGKGCYADIFGTVEANVGDNKANYFLTRSVKVEVDFDDSTITRRVVLMFKNSANSALGVTGRYKNYLRFLIPEDSEISDASFEPEVIINKGRKEVGALVEVLGGQNKEVSLVWKTKLNKPAMYRIYIRKQAGIGDDSFSLTVNGNNVYNTVLTQDIWTKEF